MKKKSVAIGLAMAVLFASSVYAMGMGWPGRFGGQIMGYGYTDVSPEGSRFDAFLVNGWNMPQLGMMGYGMGSGMMTGYGMMGPGGCEWHAGYGWQAPSADMTIEDAEKLVEEYISGTNLEIKEMMNFEYNYYAQVIEKDTGIGAMELLVDKYTGAVYPEPGPNMMWNTKYGHMSWGVDKENTVTEDEALRYAQEYLDKYLPGLVVEEHADEFYGYYTIHVTTEGEIVGMLSVNGFTGQVWYHTWHGDYLGEK